MKKITAVFSGVFLLVIVAVAFNKKMGIIFSEKKEQDGFALIELFTSEGCSSCPPADEAVSDIQEKYTGKNVLILGYHVDYWDRLGWKDVFSSHEFTSRQEFYAGIFNLNSIYTPEAVINGTEEFVGSDKIKLTNTVEEKLKEKATATIHLNANQNVSGKIEITYSISENNSKEEQLILLLVQKTATNNIKRGENEGKILHHINIVRELSILSAASNKETKTFSIPSGLKKEDVFLAAFIQNKKTGKITGIQSSQIN